MLQARWTTRDLIIEDKILAVRNDILTVLGKHKNGKYMVRGLRSESYFWAEKDELEFLGDEPIPKVG
jgi:hypothetical protein